MSLAGLSVLVTRPQHQAGELVHLLEDLEAQVFTLPAIEIMPSEDNAAFDSALRGLDQFDTVVLTSVNGVRAVCHRMHELSIPLDSLSSRRLAVIGPSTGKELAQAVRAPDVMPAEYVSEALADALGDVNGQRILLCRADLARPELASILTARGAEVTQVVAYRIVRGTGDFTLPDRVPDYITLTSSAAVRGTLELLEAREKQAWMRESRLICIGPITADTVRELGFTPAAVAEAYTIPGLVDALLGTREASHA